MLSIIKIFRIFIYSLNIDYAVTPDQKLEMHGEDIVLCFNKFSTQLK